MKKLERLWTRGSEKKQKKHRTAHKSHFLPAFALCVRREMRGGGEKAKEGPITGL